MKGFRIAVLGVLFLADVASAVGLRVVDTLTISWPGQEVEIFTTGSGTIHGVNLYIQVGDGGPLVGGSDIPGFSVAPVTDIRFDGGIWGPVAPDAGHVEIYDGLLAYASFLAPAPGVTVTAPGKVATLVLDGVGVRFGQFQVALEIPRAGARSDFVGVPADELIPGTILHDIPEPASALLMLGFPLLARRYKR